MMVIQPGRFGAASCAIDPFAASRTFFLRGDGVPGTKPTTDELGNALTYYGNVGLSNFEPRYWADYQTTMRTEQSGRIVMPVNRWDLGLGGAPFSILIRFAIFGSVGPASGIVFQAAASSGSWGPGGIQSHLWWTGAADLRWQFFGSSSPSSLNMAATSGGWGDHAFREALITYDGTTTSGYCNGTRVATTTGTYTKVTGTSACVGSAVDGTASLYMAFTDLTVYGTCLTTASSYTLPTLPPC